ncbi:4-alpha-glucanotransferase [Solobacterium sp.]|uniref:4-alpha-glucanotransferase n=1 Tax=Solobacterium sp. TaxID=2060878 RepID=UPI001CAD8FCC|nr:4-alpha-glucanotransferase [Solobacterium sp.]MBF1085903.1 4-alpha-glucanotransferase [Solobacterium sp.]
MNSNMRKAGILMPVASLPGRHGCGTFGKEAYDFVKMMHQSGLGIWQLLPLNPLGYGNSPYQPYSSYAVDELYISLDVLAQQGLLEKVPSYHRNDDEIQYEEVRQYHDKYLRLAYQKFEKDEAYESFIKQSWVKEYAIFKTFKVANNLRPWNEWEKEQKDYPINQKLDLSKYEDEIAYQMFLQFVLHQQWHALKKYANSLGIQMVGDIPFYVGLDSADVWAHRENFLLDQDGRPTFIAGVPPDYFSATGQRWGNPIYDWDFMKKDKFTFWIERMSYMGEMFDVVRVDHFRAFDTYWKIPADCPTAIEGEWIEAPGYELFDTLFKQYPNLTIVAEDLGDLRPEVLELRDHYKFRGMRIVQFTFDPEGMEEDKTHLLVYTGTHDNDTTYSWYCHQSASLRRKMRQYLWKHGYRKHSFVDDVIDYSLDSNADMVIIPMSDWIHAGSQARLNMPGSVGAPNWMWRMKDLRAFAKRIKQIKLDLLRANRINHD